EIGADRHNHLHPHRQKLAACIKRKLCIDQVVAPLSIGKESLRASAYPFDRASCDLGGVARKGNFIENRRFEAKTAAGIACNDTNRIFASWARNECGRWVGV